MSEVGRTKVQGLITVELQLHEFLLIHFRRKYGSQNAAADHLGVSTAFLSQVCSGTRNPSERILDDAGLTLTKTVTVQRKVRNKLLAKEAA